MKAILFDLDETLILDEAISEDAFLVAARLAQPHGALPVQLADTAGQIARRLWAEGPCYEYCLRIGHSAWEGLWARYDKGDHPMIARLREWAPGYRVAVWREALTACGIASDRVTGGDPRNAPSLFLPEAQAIAFMKARRQYPLYPEVPALLEALRSKGYLLGIVTNGVPDLQREKLAGCGIAHLFHAAVVSGEIDCGKPDPGIFRHICRELGVAPADCIMVGDNPARDVAGAMAAGIRSVWVSRNGRRRDERYPGDLACTDLSEMLLWLAQIG
jgi:putative hydrolase of the HAD superfamily